MSGICKSATVGITIVLGCAWITFARDTTHPIAGSMTESEMLATFGDNLVFYEPVWKTCEFVQYLGQGTASCHYCSSSYSKKVCCACPLQDSGLCSDSDTRACEFDACYVATVQTGPPTSCRTPACGEFGYVGVCGGAGSVCPTFHKKGDPCFQPPA